MLRLNYKTVTLDTILCTAVLIKKTTYPRHDPMIFLLNTSFTFRFTRKMLSTKQYEN